VTVFSAIANSVRIDADCSKPSSCSAPSRRPLTVACRVLYDSARTRALLRERGSSGNPSSRATSSGCPDEDELQIALDDPSIRGASNLSVADLNGFLHPVYLEGRFSIGVSFD
jgi:hypothetical protein